MTVSTGLALLAGAVSSAALFGAGMLAAAASSYPLALGFDLRGDSRYPFPWPEGVFLGVLMMLLGVGLAVAVIRVAGRSRVARRFGVVLLCGLAAASVAVSVGSNSERRCASRSYDSSTHCTSGARAAARDLSAVVLPVGAALVGLKGAGRRAAD